MAKEKSADISLIEAENETNNGLLVSFPTKSSGISVIFIRHPTRAKASIKVISTVSLYRGLTTTIIKIPMVINKGSSLSQR